MAREGTLRVVVAVLFGVLAALCLLSLASAQVVETECTPLKPKACKKSANCFSTGKKKNHRCTVVGPLGEDRCNAVQKAKGKPNMRTRCGEQTAPGGRCECAKPKNKCGAYRANRPPRALRLADGRPGRGRVRPGGFGGFATGGAEAPQRSGSTRSAAPPPGPREDGGLGTSARGLLVRCPRGGREFRGGALWGEGGASFSSL